MGPVTVIIGGIPGPATKNNRPEPIPEIRVIRVDPSVSNCDNLSAPEKA